MKRDKTASLDGIGVEMLKGGGVRVAERGMRIFNKCLEIEDVPKDWKETVNYFYL